MGHSLVKELSGNVLRTGGVNLVDITDGDAREGHLPYGVIGRINGGDCRTDCEADPHKPHHNNGADNAGYTGEEPQKSANPNCQSLTANFKIKLFFVNLLNIIEIALTASDCTRMTNQKCASYHEELFLGKIREPLP